MTNKHLLASIIILFSFCLPVQASIADATAFNTFASQAYQYSIQYPQSWKLFNKGNGVVVFKNTSNDQQHAAMVNIQTIYTRKGGGKYASIKDLMDDFYSQVPLHTQAARFLERSPIRLQEPDGTVITGEQTVFTFKENGSEYKQWQIMLVNKNGILFQALAYRANVKYFDDNYALAKTMFTSWILY